MNVTLSRRLPVVTAFAATSILAANLALAAWTTTGTGSGSAVAGSHVALRTVIATADDPLVPQNSANVRLTIRNDNPYVVEITNIDQTSAQAITVDQAHEGCNVSSLTFTNQSGSWVVGKNATLNVQLSKPLAMSNAALDACKGAVFTIPVTLTGVSSTKALSNDGF